MNEVNTQESVASLGNRTPENDLTILLNFHLTDPEDSLS